MIRLFTEAKVRVDFVDYPPNNVIDRTLFDATCYSDITSHGLSTRPIKLIHCASVHYQPRYQNSPSQRFLNAFFETKTSFRSNATGSPLVLGNGQSPELKKSASEVLAVGLCLDLSTKLFDIPLNRINVIETSGKRCDFVFDKSGRRYELESKGREHKNQINAAIQDVFNKKANSVSLSKYGFVSHLPRDNSPVTLTIVDPEGEPIIPTPEESIVRLLAYYAKASRLSGFWRLADLLNIQVEVIQSGVSLSNLEGKALDYENIIKLGRGYELRSDSFIMETFFPVDPTIGFRDEDDGRISFVSLDKRLLELLERQNFEAILDYRPSFGTQGIIESNAGNFSVNNDGTVFGIVPTSFFEGR